MFPSSLKFAVQQHIRAKCETWVIFRPRASSKVYFMTTQICHKVPLYNIACLWEMYTNLKSNKDVLFFCISTLLVPDCLQCPCSVVNLSLFPTRWLWHPELGHVGVDIVEAVRVVLEVFFNLVTFSRSADIRLRLHRRSRRSCRTCWWRRFLCVPSIFGALTRRGHETLPDVSCTA